MKKEQTKIAVKKIVITMNGCEVSVSLDEARQLQAMLNEMFGKEKVVEKTVEHIHHYDYWRGYWQPTIWYGAQGTAAHDQKLQTLYCGSTTDMSIKARHIVTGKQIGRAHV